ncbi:MAG: zinc ribbon domain-containing protein [Bryobacteraceae bacterium]
MPEFCSCGAQLPPDALFCHRCGKPQRELPVVQEEPAPSLPPVQPESPIPALPPGIGLRNSQAVRVALLTGSLTFLVSLMPLPIVLRFLLLVAAGALSVYLYRRRSGMDLEVPSGARMGWITGLFCFVIFTVLFTVSVAVLTVILRDASLEAAYRQQMSSMGMSPENIQQAMEALQNPAQLIGALLTAFVILTTLPALGGALGARLFRGN